ncbi:DUF4177 domain-containing protein [Planktotalea sp.]|uniref:DUF4177 domain-containing protein n=1 Tax=Planktotalea sp. TaxID=2029877 RepID=UPI003D6A63E2
MTPYEYKVIPAPMRGQKGKGVKGADGRFAHALETAMNEMAAIGWEYQRAETLPSEERAGLTSKTTVFRNVLVFRRAIETQNEREDIKRLEAPADEPTSAPPEENAPEDHTEPQSQAHENIEDDTEEQPQTTHPA